MDLELTPEQSLLQQSVRRLASDNIAAQARQWDVDERFPTELIAPVAQLGLWGVCLPTALGGCGLGALEMALVVEELAAADGSVALVVASHNGLCAGHLKLAGSGPQKERFLPPLARGEGLGAWALTEPGSGSDAVAMSTTARRHQDGWLINGAKVFITQGTIAKTTVVVAVTDPAAGRHGVTAFIVEANTPGLSARPIRHKLGMRATDTAELSLQDVYVPDSQRLGEVGAGFVDVLKVLVGGRITIAALSVGLLRGALCAASRYAQQRQQFGQPIGQFQAIQWKLANMSVDLEAARLLTHQAAVALDSGQPAHEPSAIAKLFASEAAVRGCEQAVQVHGGYGYTSEFPVGRMWRDAKLMTIGEGTSEIHRSLIAKQVLKRAL